MIDYTRRIVESPVFCMMPGLFGEVSDETKETPEVHHVRYVNESGNISFGVLNAVDYDELYGDDSGEWRSYFRILLDGPVAEPFRDGNTALLIYMLSKHCWWAKLERSTVYIGYRTSKRSYIPGEFDIKSFKAPTLAETFWRAFDYVEGLSNAGEEGALVAMGVDGYEDVLVYGPLTPEERVHNSHYFWAIECMRYVDDDGKTYRYPNLPAKGRADCRLDLYDYPTQILVLEPLGQNWGMPVALGRDGEGDVTLGSDVEVEGIDPDEPLDPAWAIALVYEALGGMTQIRRLVRIGKEADK